MQFSFSTHFLPNKTFKGGFNNCFRQIQNQPHMDQAVKQSSKNWLLMIGSKHITTCFIMRSLVATSRTYMCILDEMNI